MKGHFEFSYDNLKVSKVFLYTNDWASFLTLKDIFFTFRRCYSCKIPFGPTVSFFLGIKLMFLKQF